MCVFSRMRRPTVVFAALLLTGALPGMPQDPPDGGFPTGGLPPVVGPPGAGPAPGAGGAPGPRGRGSAGGGRNAAGAKGKREGPEPDRSLAWDVWWELNDDRFVRARALARMADAHTSDADSVLGRTGKSLVARATLADIRDQILPALRRAAKDQNVGVRRQAAIALGKVADDRRQEVYDTLRALAADPDWEVRSGALLALGLQGSIEAVPLLELIARDDPGGRRFCGVGEQPFTSRERGFASLGIGIIGVESGLYGESVDGLIASVRSRTPHPDVRVFPALALGIMRAFPATPALLEVAFDAGAPEVVRAHAIVALGRLGARNVTPRLAGEGLGDRSAHVQRSSAIALGLLAGPDDGRTLEVLGQHARNAADRGVRNFAIIALGRIGGPRARELLVPLLGRGHQHDRTFAAIALGLVGWNAEASRAEIGRLLHAELVDAKAEHERGALAIALGLLQHQPSSSAILPVLAGGASPEVRGHFATAAGLLGDRAAVPALERLVAGSADGGLLVRAAVALATIGDPGAVGLLVKTFEGAGGNQPTLLGATLALGMIGDRTAVPPLLKALAGEPSANDLTRAYAAMALGILADKREERVLATLQESSNYLASTQWLWELLTLN
jgi:HEAT repeat protein